MFPSIISVLISTLSCVLFFAIGLILINITILLLILVDLFPIRLYIQIWSEYFNQSLAFDIWMLLYPKGGHEQDQSFLVPVLVRKKISSLSRSREKKILVPVKKKFWSRSKKMLVTVPVPVPAGPGPLCLSLPKGEKNRKCRTSAYS